MKKKSTLGKSDFAKISNNFSSFITKATQSDCFQYVQKKESLSHEQVIEQKENIQYLIIEMFKQVAQQLELDSSQLEQDSKINIYVSCVQKIGVLFCQNYNQKCQQMHCQIKNIKGQLDSNVQRLRNYMEENQFLKDQIQRLQSQMHIYNQQLDKSQHQLQKGKSQIQNQISQKQLLNHELQRYVLQCSKLKKLQQLLNNQLQIKDNQIRNKERQKVQLKNNLNQNLIYIQKIKSQNCQLTNEKECLQKQIESLKMLIDQKDYLLQNKDLKSHQVESLNYSAEQHSFIHKSNEFNIVTQQKDQEYGSDKDVLKDIQYHQDISIGALRFSNSKSGSDESQTSLKRSYEVSNLQYDRTLYIDDTPPPNKQILQKVVQTKIIQKTEITGQKFSKQKQSKGSTKKQTFHTPIPKDKSKKNLKTIPANIKNQKLKTQTNTNNNQKQKKQDSPTKKQKPIYNLNLHQIKSETKSQYNQKIILSGGRKKTIQNQRKSLQSNSMFNLRAEHCQSAEDLFKNQTNKKRHSQRKKSNNDFQSMIKNKDKIISHLQNQVKKTVQEASQKLTENQGEYQMILQKLESQIKYYKEQFRNTYNQLIIERANSEQYKLQIQRLQEQVINQKQLYEQACADLKVKCSKYLQERINEYEVKYEQIQQKMQRMFQNNVTQKLVTQKSELKKSNSSSLFYNEVKHHSYHCSQDYSQINKASPTALSKQLSVLCSQSDRIQNNELKKGKKFIDDKHKQKLINIQDYDEVQFQSWAGKQPGIDVEVQTDQIQQLKSSINFSSLQLSQDNSQCKIQETTFKSTYIQEKISKLKLTACQQMKIAYYTEVKVKFVQNQYIQTQLKQQQQTFYDNNQELIKQNKLTQTQIIQKQEIILQNQHKEQKTTQIVDLQSTETGIQTERNLVKTYSHLVQFVYNSQTQKESIVNKKRLMLTSKQINLNIPNFLAKQKLFKQRVNLDIVKSCQIIVLPFVQQQNIQQVDNQSNSSQLNESNINVHSFSTELDQTLLSQIKKILLKLKQSPLHNQAIYQVKKIQSNIQQIQRLFQNIQIQRSKLFQCNKPLSASLQHKQIQIKQKQQQVKQQFFQTQQKVDQNKKAYNQPLQKFETAKVLTNLWSSHFSNLQISSTNLSTSVSANSSPKNNLKQKNNVRQFSQIKEQDQQIEIYEDQFNNSYQSSHSKITSTQRINYNSFQIKKRERRSDKKRTFNVEQLTISQKIKKPVIHKFCKGILNNLKQLQFLKQEQKNYIARKFRLKNIKIKQVISFSQQDIQFNCQQTNQREGIRYSTNRRINQILQKQIIILNCSLLNDNLIKQNFALSGVKMIDLTRKYIMNSQNMISIKDPNMLLLGNNQIRIYKDSFEISLLNKNNHFQSTQNIQDGKWKILKAVIGIIQ